MFIYDGTTPRGFVLKEFNDRYGVKCSIQKSSLATEDAIWIGVADVSPEICIQGKGWVPFDIPDEVLIHTRMHLTIDQVKQLLPILNKFVETGNI
jgi:hypothetical protein